MESTLVFQSFELLGIYLEAFYFGKSFLTMYNNQSFPKKSNTTPSQDSILAYFPCIYI